MKMQYKSVLFWFLIVATLWHNIRGLTDLYFPPNTTESLPLSTVVTASSTCQSSGTNYSCNYCTTRTNWPTHSEILKDLDSGSTGCSTSVHVNEVTPVPTDHGVLIIDKNSTNCSFSKPVADVKDKGYTLSFWLKYICDDCQLFTFSSGGTTVNLRISGDGRTMAFQHGVDGLSIDINSNSRTWKHFALRFFESTLDFHLDGKHRNNFTNPWFPSFNVNSTIEFHNYSLGNSADEVIILDFRYYNEALTDREIEYLFNKSSILDLTKPPLNCRCSPTHPTLQDPRAKEDLLCTNRASGNTVPLLEMDAHLPVFTIDNNPATSWVTEPTKQAWILLTMDQIYQVDTSYEVSLVSNSDKIIQLFHFLEEQPAGSFECRFNSFTSCLLFLSCLSF
ncbi:usherin-like [Mizuhopecten yessoensis]|uniref:usherin-like n=1 Tax=Mizuhopecten yessoensis TaxID=6573 RepID=UPI000B45F54A|nr:usherin-like [Mizuhopecten yessoensis]